MSSIYERLKKLEDVSSKNKDSIKDLQSDVKTIQGLQSDDPKPPFTINSLLKLSWGLSLSLSKDSNQQKVGEKFMDAILELWKRRSPAAPDGSKPLNENQQIKSEFIENLVARLTATVRNIGFVKDSHSEFLDEQKARYDAKAGYYKELSEFTSVKKEGIIPKLVTFVGGGSLTTFATNTTGIFSTSEEQFDRLVKLMSSTENETKKAEIFNRLVIITEEEIPAITTSDLALFIVSGIGLTLLVSFIINQIKDDRLKKYRKKIKDQQQDYWIKQFKPELAEYIVHFYKDVKSLIKIYYGEKLLAKMQEEFLQEIGCTDNKPIEDAVMRYVQDEILPHYWISHKDDKEVFLISKKTSDELEKLQKQIKSDSIDNVINHLLKK